MASRLSRNKMDNTPKNGQYQNLCHGCEVEFLDIERIPYCKICYQKHIDAFATLTEKQKDALRTLLRSANHLIV
jgi:rRNA maturation endonuclease Nob1